MVKHVIAVMCGLLRNAASAGQLGKNDCKRTDVAQQQQSVQHLFRVSRTVFYITEKEFIQFIANAFGGNIAEITAEP